MCQGLHFTLLLLFLLVDIQRLCAISLLYVCAIISIFSKKIMNIEKKGFLSLS